MLNTNYGNYINRQLNIKKCEPVQFVIRDDSLSSYATRIVY